jgi:hypothetical protein
VTFNSFLRNHASGIQVRWGSTNIVVTGNCFQDNGVNPVTYSPSTNTDVARGAIRIADDGLSTTGTQIHDNNFAGDLPFGVENDSAASAAAENDWWGCSLGPGNPGCDAVTGPVNFIPFLSAPSATPPCSCTTNAQCPVDSNPCTFDGCAPVVDIAQGQTATQSSNLSGFDVCGGPPLAPRAVDGNTDGNYFDCSVAVTQNELQPWWQVDLGSSQDIASIKVWNRTDPSTVFWSNFHVLVSNNPALLLAGNLAAAQLVADHDFPVPGAAGSPTTIVVNFPGQYVRVQLGGTNYLQLAEVQVIAGGCVHPNNTLPCDDGLFCNGADICAAGSCTHAGDPCPPGVECQTCQEASDSCIDPLGTACTSDGNVCSADQCDGLGACDHSVPSGATTCDDGVFCDGIDTCAGPTCVSSGDPCVPGSECANVCDETHNTCNLPAGTPCTDDTLFCNGTESCNGSGACAAHSGDPCPPLNTTDANCSTSCDESTDTCTLADPNGTGCNDGLACDGTDQCNGGTCSVHSSSCAPHITMGQNGSTTVMGVGRPSLGPGCLEIFDCGFPDACQNGNDGSPIGTNTIGTNPAGAFTITVDPALICQEHLYVVDICAPFSVTAPDIGPVFVVDCAPAAPLLSPQAILFLVAALGMVGLFGLRRVTPRR